MCAQICARPYVRRPRVPRSPARDPSPQLHAISLSDAFCMDGVALHFAMFETKE